MSDWGDRAASSQIVRQHAGSALLEAMVMLLMGFFYLWQGLTGISNWAIYNYAVTAAVWTFLVGGLLLAVVAFLCGMGWGRALLADVVVSGAIAVAFAATGAIWLANSDVMGILLVLFALMSLHSARGSWAAHRSMTLLFSGAAGAVEEGQTAAEAGPDFAAKQAAVARLLQRKRGAAETPAAAPLGPRQREPMVEACSGPSVEAKEPGRVQIDDAPPEEGFLADFGKEDG